MNCAGVRCRSGLSNTVSSGLSCMMFPFLGRTDFNAAGELFYLWSNHRDDQHAVFEHGILHLNAVSQQEAPLKLPGSDPAMQEFACRVVFLLPADHELVVLPYDFELGPGKARHRDRDQEALGSVVLDGSLDIVGRIPVCGPAEPVDALLIGVET